MQIDFEKYSEQTDKAVRRFGIAAVIVVAAWFLWLLIIL